MPKEPSVITTSIRRQIELHEDIEFPAPEDNKAGSGGLGETVKALNSK